MTQGVGNRGRRWPLAVALLVIVAVVASTVWIRRGTGVLPMQGEAPVNATGSVEAEDPVPGAPPSSTPRARGAADAGERAATRMQRRKEMRERHAARSAAARTRLTRRFETERADPAWSGPKQAELRGIADSPGIAMANVAPTSMEVGCRQSVCRISSTFANAAAAGDWTQLYMASVGSSMPEATVRQTPAADGTVRVEIYGRAR